MLNPLVIRYYYSMCGGILLIALMGCTQERLVTLRSSPQDPLEPLLKVTNWGGPEPTGRTQQVLRRYDLDKTFQNDPESALDQLTAIEHREPDLELTYAVAELSYVTAAKQELTNSKLAHNLYWNAVVYSYSYLLSPTGNQQRNAYDPQFRRACDLYNGSLEKCLRLCEKRGWFKPGTTVKFPTTDGTLEVAVVTKGFTWKPADFDQFHFVSDYQVSGLVNHYRTFGLGVPLIAIRKDQSHAEAEEFYPQQLSFPTTAFLRLYPKQSGEETMRAELELFDPLETSQVSVAQREVPLESDLSTPLAHFLAHAKLGQAATFGLLKPDLADSYTGLYMLQPYQPNKIPVLMVHGLWSSPMTWMEMFNDLRSRPEIRDNYQFWFYLYPTGQPFWNSAARLRDELAEVRRVFDPHRQDASLDQMVFVGHSMGGLISRLVSVESGNRYWEIVSDKPFHLVKANPTTKARLEKAFFFPANQSVKRVISIASPHRGSYFSNDLTQFLARKLIALPKQMLTIRQELLQENSEVFRDPRILQQNLTSIDSLAPNSPVLPVLLNSPKPQWIQYHNIVGVEDRSVPLEEGTDGIVPYKSAHLTDVTSEIVVEANHVNAHRHPLAILEVRRILLDHLNQQQRSPWIRKRQEERMTRNPTRTFSQTHPIGYQPSQRREPQELPLLREATSGPNPPHYPVYYYVPQAEGQPGYAWTSQGLRPIPPAEQPR